MKEPKKFIGSEYPNKKSIIIDMSHIWTAIVDLEKNISEYQRYQTIINWIMGFSLILSVSTLVTIYLFKL